MWYVLICEDSLFVVADDFGEALGSEGGATYEAAIDIGHGHDFLDVVGLDGAAVLDDHLVSDLRAVLLGNHRADELVHLRYIPYIEEEEDEKRRNIKERESQIQNACVIQ
jgi:hypothetical protein